MWGAGVELAAWSAPRTRPSRLGGNHVWATGLSSWPQLLASARASAWHLVSIIRRRACPLSFVAFYRRTSEKIRRFDTEDMGQPVEYIYSSRINTALERTDIRAVHLRTMRELLLREASRVSKLSQIERQNLSNVHDRESNALKSISPRSILYNRSRSPPKSLPFERLINL
jgi:hypothetical protein